MEFAVLSARLGLKYDVTLQLKINVSPQSVVQHLWIFVCTIPFLPNSVGGWVDVCLCGYLGGWFWVDDFLEFVVETTSQTNLIINWVHLKFLNLWNIPTIFGCFSENSHEILRLNREPVKIPLNYPLVNVNNYMKNTIFNGNIHYFYGHVQ